MMLMTMLTRAQESLALKQVELEKEIRKKANLERELKTAKVEIETKNNELQEKQDRAQKALEEVSVHLTLYACVLVAHVHVRYSSNKQLQQHDKTSLS